MHDTRVKMKDERTYCGPIWVWRPQEGWFSVVDNDAGGAVRIELAECESAVTGGQRVRSGVVEDRDELARARKMGWDG